MDSLTPQTMRVLECIQDYYAADQLSMTIRDIQRTLGYKSVAPVQHHVRKLKEAGLVVSDPDRARTIRPAKPKPKGIPICGTIAAGGLVEIFPSADVFADSEVEYISPELFSSRSRGLERFALRVSGDSMIGAHILDEDIVILDKPSDSQTVKNGTIVAARLEGQNETTLKRWHREGKQVSLIPENPNYRTIQVDAKQVLIEGIYVGILRDILP